MIQELISKGESKTVEFKMELPKGNGLASTVCAFANRAGGYLLIGVNDNGEISGVDDDVASAYLEKIPNMIHDIIYPMLLPEIYTYNVDGRKVVVVQIYPGNNTPYYIREKGKIHGTYMRVGRTNKQADEGMIKELERQKINRSFDEDIHDEISEKNMTRLSDVLQEVFEQKITTEKLYNLQMIQRIGDMNYLTNAGAVILGVKSNARIRCARFAGESIVDFIDKKDYEGDMFTVFDNTLAFIKNHINHSGIISGSGMRRKDIYEIPEEVIREGVVNALIHRDYSIQGADIKIAVFDTKIEITSPGGLPKSLSVEEIYAGRSEIRNPAIAGLLLKSGYVEQWGSGIPRIREICHEAGLQEPIIDEKGLFVMLTIYRKVNKNLIEGRYDMKVSKSSSVKEEKDLIYDLLAEEGHVTVKELSAELNMTDASVQRRLKALQDEKRIRRVGSKKTGYWKVNKKKQGD